MEMRRLEEWADDFMEQKPGTMQYRLKQLEGLNETLLTHNTALQREVDHLKAQITQLWKFCDSLEKNEREDLRSLNQLANRIRDLEGK